MRLIIFGPQGAGKGTQAARIGEKFSVPAISTGDIFREAMASGTELGELVEEIVNRGKLVPDDLALELIQKRLEEADTQAGWLLDGFPRNLEQARRLDRYLETTGQHLDAALLLEVSEEITAHRIMGRRVCSQCGANYHVDAPPQVDWKCDRCGGDVVARSDDQDEDAIRQRLQTYLKETKPLGEYYEDKGLLRRIEGNGSRDEIFARVLEKVGR
ncbi:MAG: adenylate kinase [Actinobacteria bacterium]|nr:adenylate kinase [Actinomycetota bacterium]